MNNRQIQQVFLDIADLLSIKGESRYRIIAYERAAEAIAELSRDLEDVHREGELQNIPGVGEAIAAKIQELLETGELEYLQKLAEEVPLSLIEVLRVGNVGPKKAVLFWKELGITTVPELEAAARTGSLAELPGMGAKSQQRVLEGIESLKRHQTDRILLGQALPASEEVLNRLRALPSVEKAESAGSLRRRRETVGDLDLLAASRNPGVVMEAFTGDEAVEQVLGQGETKASIIRKDGLRMQLWVHLPERYGSALQYATGSKEHNVRMRELAQKQGLSLSEHGFRKEDGELILCENEESVYQELGLVWIPPELREDRGEVEAALHGELPDLIEIEQIKGDLHTHTDWSDGRATMGEMIEGAITRGRKYLAITDHSRSLGVANGLSIERLREQRRAIDEMQDHYGDRIHLLQGAEVEILSDGGLDFPDDVLAELDIVVASLHTSLRQPRQQVTERLLSAVNNPHVDIIGHPSGRLLGRREAADLDFEQVFSAAVKSGVALEINAHPDRLDLHDTHVRRAVELGCRISINTDAHEPHGFDVLRFGIAVARRGWLTADPVLNTMDYGSLLSWLESRGRAEA
ncbi:MAG: DNA polymerase/3'-5' exonuclease PolX [Anaerolineales bacterium]